jgi:hypothetical protein
VSGCWAGISELAIGTRTAHESNELRCAAAFLRKRQPQNPPQLVRSQNWRPSKRTVHVGDFSLLHVAMPKPASSQRVGTFSREAIPKAAPPEKRTGGPRRAPWSGFPPLLRNPNTSRRV